ncbi:hypothetical protein [Actinacidiphila oryziradicis]|nr:hypothetical protein [Actinacidiphila oryziradicis]
MIEASKIRKWRAPDVFSAGHLERRSTAAHAFAAEGSPRRE